MELHDAPKEIYLRGDASCLTLPAVAVVGTRHASEHGMLASRSFSRAFAEYGLCVVSGLAFGVDAAAHRGALDAKGKTVAVVGSGLDDLALYPRANLRLAKDILLGGGLIVSENPPGTKPQNWDFPKRNRVIAALARVTCVIEAPEKSGALITAKYALELGREVYACPADALKESARGSNRLISSGAVPLMEPHELVAAVFPGKKAASQAAPSPKNAAQAAILSVLASGPKHPDELAVLTGLAAAEIQSALASLELAGNTVSLPGSRYALA